MKEKNRKGKIITFYSFKGGVGRTMAVANIAFLAAHNGLRVLVMDWDLEAPGLAYYFRGLLEASEAKKLKNACGVLNIMWGWSNAIKRARSEREIEKLLSNFKDGTPFQDCVQTLLKTKNGVLDFIGPGSQNINTPKPRSYEEAMAHFSWSSFFENEAGGRAIVNMREWAKRKYDIILLDSRTGLADVAGICTMQIPDAVALCFILNRQNIDGIAKVSAAIRSYREDALTIRAVPMRVARQDTSEESDARARAIWELKRVGGFSSEAIQKDFRELSVLAADNVPFYETLTPFTATNPQLDPLMLNYLGLATELLGKSLKIPSLDEEAIELIRRRLQPRHATIDYITKLKSADPIRTVDELQRLIESAFVAELDGGELEDDYITALVDASLETGLMDFSDSISNVRELQNRTLDLLRTLADDDSKKWRPLLSSSIEKHLEIFNFDLELEEELALLEELDGLLAQLSTLSVRLKRINYRRRAAHLFVEENNEEAAMQTIGEIRALLKEVKYRDHGHLGADQREDIAISEVDIFLLTGDVYRFKENFESSYDEYKKGLEKLEYYNGNKKHIELRYLCFELHSRLTIAHPPFLTDVDAANHAVKAFSCSGGYFFHLAKFAEFAQAVLKVPNHPDIAVAFCEAIMKSQAGQSQDIIALYFGRQLKLTYNFLEVIEGLCKIIVSVKNDRAKRVLLSLVDRSKLVLQNFNRRRQTIEENERNELSIMVEKIIEILIDSGLPSEIVSDLEKECALLSYGGLNNRGLVQPE